MSVLRVVRKWGFAGVDNRFDSADQKEIGEVPDKLVESADGDDGQGQRSKWSSVARGREQGRRLG